MNAEQQAIILLIRQYLQENTRRRIRKLKLLSVAIFHQLNNGQNLNALSEYLLATFPPKRIWSFERPRYEFDLILNEDHADETYWKNNFRMSQECFKFICELSAPFLEKQRTRFRETIPLKKRVAVALHWLAHGGNLFSAGAAFGVAKPTAFVIVTDFINGMFDLRNKFIQFPVSLEDCNKVINTFKEKTLLPNVMGAIDCIFVEIIKPKDSAVDYFSRKQKYMIINQAVCDGDLVFLCVDSGYPGSIHNSRVLDHTWLSKSEIEGIFKHPVVTINNNIDVKPYLLGSPAYPLTSWCMKPFPYSTKKRDEIDFNYQLLRGRSVIERAVEVLKGRWNILKRCLEVCPLKASKIFTVCCILHNILQSQGDDFGSINASDDTDKGDGNTPITFTKDEVDINLRKELASYVFHESVKIE